MHPPTLSDPAAVFDLLTDLYEGRARRPYGLAGINQRAHALQSGALARSMRCPRPLVVAALLHDIGHMIHELGDHPAARGVDDRHEDIGADWLARHFAPAVVDPVRGHVAAKRYLCAVDPGYLRRLSRDSLESLQLQGGPMTPVEVVSFQTQAHWQDAVVLRRIDDLAKDPAASLPSLGSFREDVLALLEPREPER